MDALQEELIGRLHEFNKAYPASAPSADKVKLVLDNREVYVLVDIINEWDRVCNPLMKAESEISLNR